MRTTSSTGSDRGFTLLEVVIVVLVISLAIGISYPSLSRGNAIFQLRAAGRDVLNTLRYARERAITEQRRLIVVVDRDAQKLVLSDEFGDGGRTFTLPSHARITRMAHNGQEIAQGPLVIHYLPNGSSDSAEILLQSDNGGTLRVVTDPIIGGARIVTRQGEDGR
jgi:prepilin-type N-terminal cleavage/methylation domain-containing protein